MDSLNVEFDYPKAVYLPGQSVSGAVVFHLKAPESFKGGRLVCAKRFVLPNAGQLDDFSSRSLRGMYRQRSSELAGDADCGPRDGDGPLSEF